MILKDTYVDQRQARNTLEVSSVECCHTKIHLERRGADHKIFKRKNVAQSGLLAIDLTGQLRDLGRNGKYSQIANGSIGELLTKFACLLCASPVNAMGELNDADGGKSRLYVPVGLSDML